MFGGGFDPSQMEQMMNQLGIDMEEVDAEEAVITTADGSELVFEDVEVTKMDAQGQTVYQLIGEPEEAGSEGESKSDETTEEPEEEGILDEDVGLVAQRAGVPEEEAREAIEAEDGDLAAAVERLT